jgi:hypothetical protein
MIDQPSGCTRVVVVAVTFMGCAISCSAAQKPPALPRDYNVEPVSFNLVYIDDSFWTPRLDTSREVTIPYAFGKCEETDVLEIEVILQEILFVVASPAGRRLGYMRL